jgi:hypothetical protein
MTDITIVTITEGTVLQGDGGASTGAIVLQHKQADNYTDVILCDASVGSPYDPYVVWTYNHERGTCSRGEYFNNLDYAKSAYEEREW